MDSKKIIPALATTPPPHPTPTNASLGFVEASIKINFLRILLGGDLFYAKNNNLILKSPSGLRAASFQKVG